MTISEDKEVEAAAIPTRDRDGARGDVMSQVMMLCVRHGAAPFNPVRDA
ncbi:hypothetical protein QVL82_02820 [Cellulosimicrobium funkei]